MVKNNPEIKNECETLQRIVRKKKHILRLLQLNKKRKQLISFERKKIQDAQQHWKRDSKKCDYCGCENSDKRPKSRWPRSKTSHYKHICNIKFSHRNQKNLNTFTD